MNDFIPVPSAVTPVRGVLTSRDLELLAALHTYRYLSVPQIVALRFPSRQTACRRLRRLQATGWLTISRFIGFDERVVALTPGGAEIVAEYSTGRSRQHDRSAAAEPDSCGWSARNILRINDVCVGILHACDQHEEVRLRGLVPAYADQGIADRDPPGFSEGAVSTAKQWPHVPSVTFALARARRLELNLLEIDWEGRYGLGGNPDVSTLLEFYGGELVSEWIRHYQATSGVRESFDAIRLLVLAATSERLQTLRRRLRTVSGKYPLRLWLGCAEGLRYDTDLLTLSWIAAGPARPRIHTLGAHTSLGPCR